MASVRCENSFRQVTAAPVATDNFACCQQVTVAVMDIAGRHENRLARLADTTLGDKNAFFNVSDKIDV